MASHFPYYIAEILVTRMSTEYPTYFAHHLLALPLLVVLISEKNSRSFATIFPFFTHAIYWYPIFLLIYCRINPWMSIDFYVLGIYNFSFLVCGLIALHISVISEGKRAKLRIPLLCIFEVAVNFYSYCTDYNGEYCDRGMISSDKFFGNKCLTAILTLSILFISVSTAKYLKGAKKNRNPHFKTRKQDEGIHLLESDAVSCRKRVRSSYY